MVYLVGVNHGYQFMNERFRQSATFFEQFLSDTMAKKKLSTIIEEFNEESRELWQADKVVCEAFAKEHNLQHCFCEPTKEQRNHLGILGELGVIKAVLGKSLWTPAEECREDVQRALKEDFRRREEFWFTILSEHLAEEVLFICGCNHLESFSSLIVEQGGSVTILASFPTLQKEN